MAKTHPFIKSISSTDHVTTEITKPTQADSLPGWMREEYGWDTLADVDWRMLRHNLRCMDNVIANPDKFPRANRAALETKSHDLFAFLASHLQSA